VEIPERQFTAFFGLRLLNLMHPAMIFQWKPMFQQMLHQADGIRVWRQGLVLPIREAGKT
jgi:hypothetical protein